MTSSALSKRRSFLRRPKVCLPPPPPPPPLAWPPESFPFLFEYSFDFEEGRIERAWEDVLVREVGDVWEWRASFGLSPQQDAEWLVDIAALTAELRVSGIDEDYGAYLLVAAGVVVTPYVATGYSIGVWDEKPGEDWAGLATFTF